MTSEATVKKHVKKLLDLHHTYHHWPVQSGYGAPALDCNGCINGRRFDIETKAPGKHPTPRQELIIRDLKKVGSAVFIIGEREPLKGVYSGMDELHIWLTRQAK